MPAPRPARCRRSYLPGIVHGVVDYRFSVWLDGHWEFDRLGVLLLERCRLAGDVPVRPAVEVLDHADGYRRLLVVADFDLEAFVEPVPAGVDLDVGAAAFADHVEGV